MKTITKHYIDGEFVESHGLEVMDIVNPANGKVIAQVALADEEDARRAIAAAKRAFASFGRTTKEERGEILRSLHKAVSRAPLISRRRWSRSMVVSCSSQGPSCRQAPPCSLRPRRRSTNCR